MAKEHVNPHHKEHEHDKDKPKPKKGEPGYVGSDDSASDSPIPGGPTGKGDSDGDDDGD
jgi:hypothetical protein